MLRYVFIIMCYFYELSNTSILSNRTVKICDCCYCYQVVCLPLEMLLSLFVTYLPLRCSDRMLYFVTSTAHHPSAIMHLCIYTLLLTITIHLILLALRYNTCCYLLSIYQCKAAFDLKKK